MVWWSQILLHSFFQVVRKKTQYGYTWFWCYRIHKNHTVFDIIPVIFDGKLKECVWIQRRSQALKSIICRGGQEKKLQQTQPQVVKNILLFRIVIMIHFNIIIIMFLHISIVVNCKQPKMCTPLLLLIATLLAIQERDTTLLECRNGEQ